MKTKMPVKIKHGLNSYTVKKLLHDRNNILGWLTRNMELLAWITALLSLALMNTTTAEPSLCVFRFAGFDHCPGCGLGSSIQYAIHLQLFQSFNAHPFGVPAVGILLYRIKQLLFSRKTVNYEI